MRPIKKQNDEAKKPENIPDSLGLTPEDYAEAGVPFDGNETMYDSADMERLLQKLHEKHAKATEPGAIDCGVEITAEAIAPKDHGEDYFEPCVPIDDIKPEPVTNEDSAEPSAPWRPMSPLDLEMWTNDGQPSLVDALMDAIMRQDELCPADLKFLQRVGEERNLRKRTRGSTQQRSVE